MKIVIASSNQGKLSQFKTLFKELSDQVEFLSLTDIGYDKEIIEDGTTYEENSLIKANQIVSETGYIALGEDSGLNIDALPGELGLYTARFGKGLTKQQKLELVLEKLKNVPHEKRIASFISVITCKFPNGDILQTKGTLHGHITTEIVNIDGGMAYTPIFVPVGSEKTLSQLTEEELVKVNHRGIAARKFVIEFLNYIKTNKQ